MDLTRSDFRGGWNPSSDQFNGPKNCLLRADNLTHDEDGSLTLVPGTRVLAGPFAAPITTVYSKQFDNIKHRFVHTTNGNIRHIASNSDLITGGSAQQATFISAYGNVFMFSGLQMRKFDGTKNTKIGLKNCPAPVLKGKDGPIKVYATSNWSIRAGPSGSGSTFDTNTTVGSIFSTQPVDFNSLGSQSQGLPTDTFSLSIVLGDTSLVTSVQIVFILNGGDPTKELKDYYHFEWQNDNSSDSPFIQGTEAPSTLSCQRQDFTREGADSTADWSSITCVMVTISVTGQVTNNTVQNIQFAGGSAGPVNGRYTYMVVAVRDNGVYQSKSSLGTESNVVEVTNGTIDVTPGAFDSDATELHIYRRSADPSPDATAIGDPAKLDQWYRTKIISPASATTFNDNRSDQDILLEGTVFNANLLSLYAFEDEILGGCAGINARNIYITFKDVIISDFLDPESYNPQQAVRLSGSNTEKNLWAIKLSNSTVLIATTQDIYELSGTFIELADGSLDILVRSLGLKPPLSKEHFTDIGSVYYAASDGWRLTTNAGTQVLSTQLDLLFKKNELRYNIPPVAIVPNNNASYPVALHNNKLYTFNPCIDGTRRGFVYNLKHQCWEYYYLDPTAIYVEEDNTLIAGFGGGSGNYLRQLYFGNSLDETTGQQVTLWTLYDDNGQPRNRKDVFTLAIQCDTGNDPVDIYVGIDGHTPSKIGSAITFNGLTTKRFTLYNWFTEGPGIRYQVQIIGQSLKTFRFQSFSIEYDPFPEQLTTKRIQPENLGTMSRKRFIAYAFVIDTLGNTVKFTPNVDLAPLTPETGIIFNGKSTYIYYMRSEVLGTDIGGLIEGGPFEFYGINLGECVSEKLPVPTKYLVIPASDYGTPNRKRHSSYKFQINTRGSSVRFTPIIDGNSLTPLDFSTASKVTVEYFFTTDTVGIDIGGILETQANTPFEFYGAIVPQIVEALAPRLKEYRSPETNYGIAAKKRVRTLPIDINTNGQLVTVTPLVDHVAGTPGFISTPSRGTAFYYFNTDIFGVDFAVELTSFFPFEFYGLLKPEEVEILPVGKKFDQLGPLEFDRMGKLLSARFRLISTGTVMPYSIYCDDVKRYSSQFTTTPGLDMVYELFQLPKTITGTVYRIELGPTDVFYRYYGELKANISGGQTDAKWVKIK